jgi:hypothetical protein
MADDEEGSTTDVLRQHSSSLFNVTSSVVTGGATVPVPTTSQPSEATPLRQSSHRRSTRSQYQARLQEEVFSLVRTYLCWFSVFGLLLLALGIAIIYFFIMALTAVIAYFNVPCDEPLKFYLLVVVLWSRVPSMITPWFQETFNLHSPFQQLGLTIGMALPGWCIIGWGVYMVSASKTCAKTNPGLFYPTENFIIAQIISVVLLVIVSTISLVGLRHFVSFAARLNASPGCANAVRKLPKVSSDSSELIDDTDGEVMDCPICMYSFKGTQAIVKTNCSHYFHEDCLATWCENHVDCPLCRQEVGEEDEIGDTPRGSDAC